MKLELTYDEVSTINYKKVYEAVVAQREQADQEYKQAAAALKETEVKNA